MQFGTTKAAVQTAPFTQTFTGGTFEVLVRDGLVLLDPACVIDPQLFAFPPSALPPCPLGATGFIATGDVDRDGIRDDLQYWSLTGDIPAYYIEPYRPDLVLLNAAPASSLPRPLGLFRDDGVTSFYNIRATTLQYDQARYELVRPYAAGNGEMARMKRDLPYGQYQYTYPSLGRPNQPLAIPVTLTPFVEAYQPTTNEKTAFRVTNSRWNAGSLEMDPRLINKLTWQGNDNRAIRSGVDSLRFGIYDAADVAITFPPSGELTIPNPLTNFYNVPPFFYAVGDTGTARFTFRRNMALNSISYDVSSRQFKFKIRFIDTYAGFTAITYPLGSTSTVTRATGDFDADGFTNLLEYAYGSDPQSNLATPLTSGNFTITDLGGNIQQITITKRANVGASLTYGFESKSGTKWVAEKLPTVVGASNARWTLTANDETQLVATSVVAIPVPPNEFRPAVKQNY